jgi:solute carrier family 6 amino acid transporter-like protein 5/7/9/14
MSFCVFPRGHCITEPEELLELRQNLTHYYGCKTGLNGSELFEAYGNDSCSGLQGVGLLQDVPRKLRRSSAEEYFKRNVLKETGGLEDIGGVEWQLALSLLAAWILTFLCLFKGIQTSGKVVYFTAIFPIVVLVILLIRAATLPGAMTGVEFYIRPNFAKLSDVKVWEAAAVQIFFSLSVAGGGLTTLSSYNKFHDSIVVSTLVVCFGTSILAVLAGFTIFSVLGFMAEELGVRVEDVVQEGSGLAFIAFPDLVTRLPVSPLWAILFFFMMFCLGLDSQFATVEIILTGILDWEPRLRPFKSFVIAAVCSLGFLFGLPLTTGGGRYVLELTDHFVAGWPFLFIALCELIIISYIYGLDHFQKDIKAMIGVELSSWGSTHFNFVFYTLSPVVLFFLLILSWAQEESLTSGSYVYPLWANGVGWGMAMLAIFPVPLVAAAKLCRNFYRVKSEKSFAPRFRLVWADLLVHTPKWRTHAEATLAHEEGEPVVRA